MMAVEPTISARTEAGSSRRTAVLVVHGMGNQRPLMTVRQIVDALYGHAPLRDGDSPRRWWTKLDRDIGDIDLPVITTAPIAAADGERVVDFHECYWAPLMAEARFIAVPMWLFELVRKGQDMMPARVKPLWFIIGALLALWIVSAALLVLTAICGWMDLTVQGGWGHALPWLVAAALCGFTMHRRGLLLLAMIAGLMLAGEYLLWERVPALDRLPMGLVWPIGERPLDLIVALAALAAFILFNWFFLLTVIGDAARYLRGAPSNIEVRRAIRSMGVGMLQRLHSANWDGRPKYDRIIIVAHSLGSVVAYDMLRAYWGHVAATLGDPHDIGPDGLEQDNYLRRSDPQPWTPAERGQWRNRARRLVGALDALMLKDGKLVMDGAFAKRWIVSDFITLGSPLAQASFLLTEGTGPRALGASFARKLKEREFPTSPAPLSKDRNLSFTTGRDNRLFHHGALFGLTRWTNLYFPVRAILWGDPIGGPTRPLFGEGVEDKAVRGAPFGNWLGHIAYWRSKPPWSAKRADGIDQQFIDTTGADDPHHHLTALRDAVDLWDDAAGADAKV